MLSPSLTCLPGLHQHLDHSSRQRCSYWSPPVAQLRLERRTDSGSRLASRIIALTSPPLATVHCVGLALHFHGVKFFAGIIGQDCSLACRHRLKGIRVIFIL